LGVDAGDCDFRYAGLPEDDAAAAADPEDSDLEDRYLRRPDGACDTSFRDRAAALGGCPGRLDPYTQRVSERAREIGFERAVAQDEVASVLCASPGAPGLAARPGEDTKVMLGRLLERALGRRAEDTDVAELARAAESCVECTPADLARDFCAGIVGGVEY